MDDKDRYPIGQQNFREIRKGDAYYVDKTSFIAKIAKSNSRYYFLARPRRFGKSLFLSTLEYFYKGERNLFKGLYADSMDWDWTPYPVLRLDLNTSRYENIGLLDGVLDNIFNEWEELFEIGIKADGLSSRFRNIIKAAHEKTGKQVVILVDEYDKPLVVNLNKDDNFEHYRVNLASIYSNFKSSAEHIKLVFLTGVSRFSKLSVFSDLNNLRDITFENEFADICGITEDELLANFHLGIDRLAKTERITFEEACQLLKKNYDGYRFSATGSDIYNPWSLLNCLSSSQVANYWNYSGKATIIVEALKRVNADLEKIFNSYCTDAELRGMDLLSPNPKALLLQTGYLTIKTYNKKIRSYQLGIPNEEIKEGLFNDLIPYYVKAKSEGTENDIVSDMVRHFILGEPEEAMICLQAYFAGVHFKMKMDNENNFHNAFFLLMDIIGLQTETESATSDGSIDITVKTEDYIYVIELKYDGSAEKALEQIEEKKYARKFQADGRKIFKIGVNFSSRSRCIEGWIIQ